MKQYTPIDNEIGLRSIKNSVVYYNTFGMNRKWNVDISVQQIGNNQLYGKQYKQIKQSPETQQSYGQFLKLLQDNQAKQTISERFQVKKEYKHRKIVYKQVEEKLDLSFTLIGQSCIKKSQPK